jgi:hypothetical protein
MRGTCAAGRRSARQCGRGAAARRGAMIGSGTCLSPRGRLPGLLSRCPW